MSFYSFMYSTRLRKFYTNMVVSVILVDTVQSDCFLGVTSPLLSDARIELQAQGQAAQQQRGPVHHAQLVGEVHDAILLVQRAMPLVIEVLRLEGAEHEPAELGQEPRGVRAGPHAEVAEIVGDRFVGVGVGDAQYQLGNFDPFLDVQSFDLSVIDETDFGLLRGIVLVDHEYDVSRVRVGILDNSVCDNGFMN